MFNIAILIPVHNHIQYTKTCIQKIKKALGEESVSAFYKIIVIDDGSTDGTSGWLEMNHSDVIILKGDGNLWWSGGINTGAKYAIEDLNCTHLLLWNNDIISNEGYFREVIARCKEYGDNVILGSKIYLDFDQDIIWSYGGIFDPTWGKFGMIGYLQTESVEHNRPMEVDWLTGMGTIVPANVIHKIGYWNQKDFPQYHGDTEFTYRAKKAGMKILVLPSLVLWNDTTNTGISRKESFRDLVTMLKDKRSLYNLKVNLKFLKYYSKSPLAYFYLVKMYAMWFGGFIKNKLLGKTKFL
jgi:GT2 family glycosyltransferase